MSAEREKAIAKTKNCPSSTPARFDYAQRYRACSKSHLSSGHGASARTEGRGKRRFNKHRKKMLLAFTFELIRRMHHDFDTKA